MDREVLLVQELTINTELRSIADILGTPVMERTADYKFVNAFINPDHYLSRSFVIEFPYGRGCPSDRDASKRDYHQFRKMMLTRGGGPQARRFQKSTNFIFTMYIYEMRKRLGGVSYRAQKHYLDDNTVQEVDLASPVGEVNEVIDIFQNNTPPAIQTILNDELTPEATKKLISRLVPYSKNLPGTKMHILYERTKLLAMIPASIITNENSWRYLITFAPPDVYDPRLYDITADENMLSAEPTWDQRRDKVTRLLNRIKFS
jgi:hypothetical protein